MDRRGFLIGAGALLATGCARVQPPALTATPQPSTPTAVPFVIGSDDTPAGAMLAELVVVALAASGRTASTTAVDSDWQAALGDGGLSVVPAYARTVWAELSGDAEPPAADALLSATASLLAPEVSTLAASGVDASLAWMVTSATAADGITSLDHLEKWSKGKTAAVPVAALSRADGVPGLKTAYGTSFTIAKVEDPVSRATQLLDGQVDIAAFRRTEYTRASGLVTLADPDELGAPDPLVFLLNAGLGESDPDAVLIVNSLAQLLNTNRLIGLQSKVMSGQDRSAVATAWLQLNGLA